MSLRSAVKNFMSAKDFDDEYYDDEDDFGYDDDHMMYDEPAPSFRERESKVAPTPIQISKTDNEKILSMNTKKDYEIVCYSPKNNLEVATITQSFKNGKVCIINIASLSNDEAQTMADFIGGAAFALGGGIKQISDVIIIAIPSNISFRGEVYEEVAKFTNNSGLFR